MLKRRLKEVQVYGALGSATVLAMAGRKTWNRAAPYINSVYARYLLGSLGFTATFAGQHDALSRHLARRRGALIVANHQGFWDMLLLASRFPLRFITSVEVGEDPIQGRLARAAGCVFVERRDRSGIAREVSAVAKHLSNGNGIVLFAEGTSTNGSRVLPFKKSFFAAAIEAQVPIVPITINYQKVNDAPLSSANRDEIFYYDDMEFYPQLQRAFALRGVEAEVMVHEAIEPRGLSREELAVMAHGIVGSAFKEVADVGMVESAGPARGPHGSGLCVGAAP
jgi:1-acyl-sn-glycerol-3-phosphate acyltransferase